MDKILRFNLNVDRVEMISTLSVEIDNFYI